MIVFTILYMIIAELEAIKAKKLSHLGHLEVCMYALLWCMLNVCTVCMYLCV